MKFPRNARMLRSQLDVTPFAGVFFCLLIFVILGALIYTPGFPLQLPQSQNALAGVAGPVVAVAMDANGQFYFQNQIITETNLWSELKAQIASHKENITLVIQADKLATIKQLNHLQDLAASAGVQQIWQQALPAPFDRAKTAEENR